APATTAVAQTITTDGAHDVGRGNSAALQRNAGFGQHEVQLVLQALLEPDQPAAATTVRRGVVDDDEHIVAVDVNGEAAHVIGERVQRAAAGEVETGVVPVAGEQSGAARAGA